MLRAPATRVAPLVISLAACSWLAVTLFDGDVFDDPPEGWVTFAVGGASFEHPRGWRVASFSEDRVVLRGPGASVRRPTAVLDLAATSATRERTAARLVTGERTGWSNYEIDVPGSGESGAGDQTFKRGTNPYRVTTVSATRAKGKLVTLTVRGPITDDRSDPRNVAGSLRLE